MLHHKLGYFASFWNLIDFLSMCVNFTVILFSFIEISEDVYIPVSAIGVVLFWFRLFYYLRIFFGASVMMIIEICLDVRYFMLIFLLAIFGYANCFHIIA